MGHSEDEVGAPVASDTSRFVTLELDVSEDVEARWVYDAERDAIGLLLRRVG